MITYRSPFRVGAGVWVRYVVQAGLITTLVLDTVWLRRRLAGLRTLRQAPPPEPDRPPASAPPPEPDRLRLLTAGNVQVDPATLASARAHARAHRLDTLDLVPADLPTAQALDLLRTLDPATYRTDRLARGWGALHATLVDDEVLRAAGAAPPQRANLSAPEMAEAVATLKSHAPATADLVVASRLTSDPEVLAEDNEVIATTRGSNAMGALASRLGWLCTLAAGAVVSPRWAVAALVAWSAQPLVVFAGSASLRPADRWSYSASRAVREPRRLFTALAAGSLHIRGRAELVEQRRPGYQAELAQGIERFFEPRRTDCPWCSSTRIAARLHIPDLLQHKPGLFTLDHCRTCGHIFQNPRLTQDGLDFYYRDFYDGLGERDLDAKFRANGSMYRSRAESLRGVAQPVSWLDVGTGHGHFCNAAREVWPRAVFDGLDMGEGVKPAEQRGWVDRGYRGGFVALAPSMTSSYDVVSMFHYLEHTREPQQELETARTVLRTGGHLVIDVPDPESAWGRLLGKWWLPWLQPQHQHFIPAGNLRRRLERLGFTVVLEQRAEAHTSFDVVGAVWLLLSYLVASGDDQPWYPTTPRPAQRLARATTLLTSVPALVAAHAGDRLLQPLAPRLGLTNAYRIVARKN